jgi:hypothetical protein
MLKELIEQARKEGKWLWCHYQDLWFSPDQLEAENAAGKFRWGPVNWKLRDPQERLSEAERRLASAAAERDQIAKSIAHG